MGLSCTPGAAQLPDPLGQHVPYDGHGPKRARCHACRRPCSPKSQDVVLHNGLIDFLWTSEGGCGSVAASTIKINRKYRV